MPLSNEQREAIRVASAEVVKACIDDRDARIPDLNALGVGNAVVSGIFVSLKRQGRLRSCMGSFGATMPLLKTLVDSSRRTATADPRFPRISAVEVPHLELEVWLLFAPEPVNVQGEARIGEVTIGTHGLQIVRGNQRGLLLPGVATDNGWDSEEFLDNVCIKAGLSPTAWKEPDTILFRFEGNCIKGGLLNGDADNYSAPRLYYQPEQIEEMGRICKGNVEAIVRGATPMYYCGTVPDSSVNGVSITVTLPGGGNELTVARMSLKELMPLQSTAFTLCEELAASLKRRGFLNGNFELDLAVVSDAAMHGTVDQPLIEGVDTSHRGFLINERQKNAWVYDREKSPTEVLADTAQACQVREPAYGMIYSLTFQATSSRVTYSAVPKPSRGPSDRPAAVAGKFYPETPAEMNAMLDEMLAGEATAEPCKAVMVPHAGWQFSGKLAADVLKRVRIPKRIIAIGPKHTPHGTDWAVAPHHNWILPEKNVASDYALAMKLVENIDGLEA
ncbi:MAG: AmmeMemoRadiSam system protein A, partial [Planctomycetales bacterium]